MTMRLRAFALSFASFALLSQGALGDSRLINGTPVQPGTWKEVVRISADGARCTATVVGPRVIVTAAHCAKNGATATFAIDGKNYSATITRSPVYPGQDHDVAIGVTNQDITGVTPATIGGTATQGTGLTLLGYGCTQPGGGGGNDGVLRIGESTIVEFSQFDMVSRKAGGAALCFGDSGGPAFVQTGGKYVLLGINSKGNIQDTNYNTRLDHQQSKTFLQAQTSSGLQICGINLTCGGGPVEPAPSCNLSVSPSTIQLGQTTTATLVTTGKVTEARINGSAVSTPSGSLVIQGTSVGTFTVRGEVTGPGGSADCGATYSVQNNPNPIAPTCTLTAVPQQVKLGQSVSLEIAVTGQATSAAIEGTPVSIPNGKKLVTPASIGNFTAQGSATGPGGTGTCSTFYEVTGDDPDPNPTAPNFSVVPSYCGKNTLTANPIDEVCLAVVKKDASVGALGVTNAVIVTYTNGTREVLPVIAALNRPQSPGELTSKQDLTLFTNTMIQAGTYQILDTRKAILTRVSAAGKRSVPTAIEGRTATGKYFIVDQLKLPGVVNLPDQFASRWE